MGLYEDYVRFYMKNAVVRLLDVFFQWIVWHVVVMEELL